MPPSLSTFAVLLSEPRSSGSMEASPCVSVVIATYNYGRFLAEAIESVQRQTMNDLEIIVVDDGSTDETPQVLAAITDPRLRVRRVPNGGVCVARNTALEMARGEFVAFLDADDRWRPTKLERQTAMFKSEPSLGLVFTNMVRFNESGVFPETQFSFLPDLPGIPSRPSAAGGGRVITVDAFESLVLLRQFPAWPSTVMVRASAVAGVEFPPGVHLAEDLHYMLRVYSRVQAGYIEEPLAELRRHGANATAAVVLLRPVVDVLTSFAAEPAARPHMSTLRRRLGREWAGLGHRLFWERKPAEAAGAYIRALRYPGSRVTSLKHLAAVPLLPLLRSPKE